MYEKYLVFFYSKQSSHRLYSAFSLHEQCITARLASNTSLLLPPEVMPGSSFPLKYQSLPSHPARVSLEAGSPMSRPRSNTTSRAARWTESYHRLLGPRHGYSAVDPPQRLWQRGLFWRRIALGLGVIGVLSWSVADVRSRSEKNGGGIDVLAADLSSGRNNSRSRLPARGKAKKAMGVRVWNDDYQVSSGQQTLELYPWDHVAEPHRTTVMEIASWPEPGDDQVLNFRWDDNDCLSKQLASPTLLSGAVTGTSYLFPYTDNT